ncbi:MAG TPA: hypothetical protein VFE47_21605 [Tepidisphaeraceae bacterium]|jgi:hypothetical protein|nr:hypothetical protein [Tepidisphaeraceae bacterium]
MFQRLLRSWETVHPYNAAQILNLAGEADPRPIQQAWHDTLAALGLGKVRTHRDGFFYESLNGEAERYPVRRLPTDTSLADHLTIEMNRPFNDPEEPPFRPFLIPGHGSFHLGVVYQHWVADSVAIRMLLRQWCVRIAESSPPPAAPPPVAQASYWDLYGTHRARLSMDQVALGLFRSYIRFRTVQKVCMTGVGDYPVRVLLRELPPGLIEPLRSAAHSLSVTVGDVLLAALAQCCHRHVPLQRRPSRRDIAIGNIIDLRPHAGRDLSGTFGLYLGFSHVVCRREDFGDFAKLLRSVNLQNQVRRRDGIAQASLAWMVAALIAQRFSKPEKIYRFYRKEIPLAAGLSNVNLAGTWAEALHPAMVLDYIRVSPTGPMAPLVLSTTTLGSRMSLALTYRPTLLDESAAGELVESIIHLLAAFTETLAADKFARNYPMPH